VTAFVVLAIDQDAAHAHVAHFGGGDLLFANTVVYTAVADKRIRNIWGK